MIDEKAKKTFIKASKKYTWRPPHVYQVIEHVDLYEIPDDRRWYGELGNDKSLVIYKNTGEALVCEWYADILKSPIIKEYSFEEFAKLCGVNRPYWPDILDMTSHFYVARESEKAILCWRGNAEEICNVGIRKGGLKDAYIDPDEKFCITVGCGLVRFDIKKEKYKHIVEVHFSAESTRAEDIERCDKIEKVTDSYILVSHEGSNFRKFDINTLKIIKE